MTELQHWYLLFHLYFWSLLNSALGVDIKVEGAARTAPRRRVQGLPFAGASHFQLVPAISKGRTARYSLAYLIWMWHLWESALKKGQKLLQRGGVKNVEKTWRPIEDWIFPCNLWVFYTGAGESMRGRSDRERPQGTDCTCPVPHLLCTT